jgi:hypothetical protein
MKGGTLFLGSVAVCLAVAVGYVAFSAARNAPSPGLVAEAEATPASLSLTQSGLVSLHKRDGGQINRVQFSPLLTGTTGTTGTTDTTGTSITLTPTRSSLQCERVYFAGGQGICVARYYPNPLTALVSVTLFGPDLQPRFVLQTIGIPSRARISRDGRFAVYTNFVTGHSYLDPNLSTQTEIIDLRTQQSLGNLETFEVYRAGQRLQSPDFNFWGVTFAAESNTFYATLRTNGTTALVRGDIRQRRIEVILSDVECPSLSPDGTRIAFKKRNPDQLTWRLHVLDLATLRETPLAETRNVDDQVEWLDNQHVLYEVVEQSTSPRTHTWLSNSDGSGTASLYLADAGSPAVLR